MHATYDETASRALDVFEKVNQDIPFEGLHWFFDHAETISDRNLERIARLGGGVAIQHRMAYQGEYFVDRYGAAAAERTPPYKRILEMGIPLGAGSDATRVASYDPWNALYWLVSGKTLGGLALYPRRNLVDRETALGLYTRANGWFSNEEGVKGEIKAGQLADLAVLSSDYFAVPEHEIRNIVSVMTIVGGKVVYGDDELKALAPPLPPAMPDWSPPIRNGGYYKPSRSKAAVAARALHAQAAAACQCATACNVHGHAHARAADAPAADSGGFWGALGCSCWAV
jgi:hypothetical protein